MYNALSSQRKNEISFNGIVFPRLFEIQDPKHLEFTFVFIEKFIKHVKMSVLEIYIQ